MKQNIAFMKKEWMDYIRTSKTTIFAILFVAIGIMNPAIAKLTPMLLDMVASSSDFAGMDINIGEVDASTSWAQFYKNIPLGLFAIVIIFCGIMQNEMSKGTLIAIVTKGFERWKILTIKVLNVILIWTMGYWITYGITYLYNDFYWDNSIVDNVLLSAMLYWIFGIFIISLIAFFSSMANSNTGVLLGVGAIYVVMSIISIADSVTKYLPNKLADAGLINGAKLSDYYAALIITLVLSVASFVGGCIIFSKRAL